MSNEELFSNNIRIAYKIAQQYKKCGIEFDDLKQLCLLELWKAVITYKTDKNCSFCTYAYRVIQNGINHYLRQNKKYFNNRYLSEIVFENLKLEDMIANPNNEIESIEKYWDTTNDINIIFNLPLKINEKATLNFLFKGYKQQKIANEIGTSQTQVSRYIKSIRKKYLAKIGG